MDEPLWTPDDDRIAGTRLTAFIKQVNERHGLSLAGYSDVYEWSVDNVGDFWTAVWDFGGVVAETRGEAALIDGDKMPGARFFPDARLNFAENLLRRRGSEDAIVFRGESIMVRRVSHDRLWEDVARLVKALRVLGVEPGDRVAGFLPNVPEAVIAMLASAALGATWSSCSPDFGKQGVIDRFGQIEPKVLFCADGFYFKGNIELLYLEDEEREGIPCRKYSLDGPGLEDRGGFLWAAKTDRPHFVDFELDLPDEPGLTSGKLKFLGTDELTLEEWKSFVVEREG